MLTYFGAKNVRIMNGGMKKWLKEGRRTFDGEYIPGKGLPRYGNYNFGVEIPKAFITDVKKVHKAQEETKRGLCGWQIIDTRHHDKFNESGQIEGSINIPTSLFVDETSGCLKSNTHFRTVFDSYHMKLSKPTVYSSSTSVNSCIVDLAWSIIGGKKAAIFDGGYKEYRQHEAPDLSKIERIAKDLSEEFK